MRIKTFIKLVGSLSKAYCSTLMSEILYTEIYIYIRERKRQQEILFAYMMTIQHVLGMRKSYTEKLMAVFKNASYITFLKSTWCCDNGQNNENYPFSVWETPVWISSHVYLLWHSFYIGYCISNSSLIHNSISRCRAAWMGQSPTPNAAPGTVPQDKRQCDAKAWVTLNTAEGLGGPCVHVIVTDTQPSLFSLMHRNLSGKVRTLQNQ